MRMDRQYTGERGRPGVKERERRREGECREVLKKGGVPKEGVKRSERK